MGRNQVVGPETQTLSCFLNQLHFSKHALKSYHRQITVWTSQNSSLQACCLLVPMITFLAFLGKFNLSLFQRMRPLTQLHKQRSHNIFYKSRSHISFVHPIPLVTRTWSDRSLLDEQSSGEEQAAVRDWKKQFSHINLFLSIYKHCNYFLFLEKDLELEFEDRNKSTGIPAIGSWCCEQ